MTASLAPGADTVLSPAGRHWLVTLRTSRLARRAAVAAALLGAGAATAWSGALPRWGAMVASLPRADLRLVAGALLLQFVSMEAFARMQGASLEAANSHVPMGELRRAVLRSNAVAVTLPVGGSAAGTESTIRAITRAGVPRSSAMAAAVVAGLFGSLGLAAILMTMLVGSGGPGLATFVAAGISTTIPLALVLLSRHPAFRTPEASSTNRVRRSVHGMLHQLGGTALTPKLMARSAAFAVVNRLADAGSFLLSVAAFSGSSPRASWLLPYLIGFGATALTVTPAGIGTVEVSLANALLAGGVVAHGAWSGAILYRVLAVGVVAGIGWLLIAADRRRRPANAAGPEREPTAADHDDATRGEETRRPATARRGQLDAHGRVARAAERRERGRRRRRHAPVRSPSPTHRAGCAHRLARQASRA